MHLKISNCNVQWSALIERLKQSLRQYVLGTQYDSEVVQCTTDVEVNKFPTFESGFEVECNPVVVEVLPQLLGFENFF